MTPPISYSSYTAGPANAAGFWRSTEGNRTREPYTSKNQQHKDYREHSQPSLRDRFVYPLKKGVRRFIDTVRFGVLAGFTVAAIPGAIVGAVPGLAIGAGVGLLKKAFCGNEGEPSSAKIGAQRGAKTGGYFTASIGAVIGGLAMAVCGVVRGILCLPMDIYRACSRNCLDQESASNGWRWSEIFFSKIGIGPGAEKRKKYKQALQDLKLEDNGRLLRHTEVSKQFRHLIRMKPTPEDQEKYTNAKNYLVNLNKEP